MKSLILASQSELMLVKTSEGYRLPSESEAEVSDGSETFQFGAYLAASLDAGIPVADVRLERRGLRESWGMMPEEHYRAASKGIELLNWSSSERYCGKDGVSLVRASDISKRCPECGREYFPRLNPAVVVLVKKGDEALLVHASTLRRNVMALVAGFVETGETLEECVAREVKEETSLEIEDIRYYGSQSWPFPHQLMIGFTARYKGGEIRFSDGELTAGAFFSRDSVPVIPTMPSLTRVMIDAWLRREI
ncbi:MAG: NAD(+) diphosphatase [Muribaculaceae bacterium]|nr:NAD(+) diphosphatase [Muribaculaceae bacterium]